MRKVYIEKCRENNNFINDTFFRSATGFEFMGYVVRPFFKENVSKLKFDRHTILHASIKTTQDILKYLNIPLPTKYNHHILLPQYCDRTFKETTLGEVRSYYNQYPFHIKPLYSEKEFTGKVINNNNADLYPLRHLKNDLAILQSECVEFDAEFRCFVLEKELIGCSNYKGNFKILPDFNIVESAIKDFEKQPVAYSIDFGIRKSDGKTILIEINDATSLGAYNLDRLLYCKMIEARWDEIVGNHLEIY